MATNYQVAVVPGVGTVLREGDTIVFIADTETPDVDLVTRLQTVASSEPTDNRLRGLARILLDEDSPPAVAVVTLTDNDASVFLYGAVDLIVGADRTSGEGQVLGTTTQTSLDNRGIAVLPAGSDAPELPAWSSLGQGAVRGAGVVITRVEAGQSSLTPTAPPVEQESVSDEIVDFASVSLIGGGLADRTPLPVETGTTSEADHEPSTPSGPAYEMPVEVLGVFSPRGFFNHPEARYCSRSGVKMGASETLVLTRGPRPPLGVLTFDDGSTYSVQWNTVIGRDPSDDDRVKIGEAALLAVDDDTQSASRQHVLLELVEWDVMVSDLGSQNGTYVRESAEAPEHRLGEGEQAVIRPDSIVRFGGRSFVYHSHHVR